MSRGPWPTLNVGDDMKDRLLEDSLRHYGHLRMSRPALSSVPAARCCKTLPERWWRRAPLRGKVWLRLRPAGPPSTPHDLVKIVGRLKHGRR